MTLHNVEDIFKEDPNDPENVIMQIPDYICEQLNWVANDTLTITIEDSKIIIKKNE